MPFIPNTPESLLTHSDPRGPASTCRGLTAAGQRCRRTIGGSPRSPRSTVDSPTTPNTEMYCWSHKDQAGSLSGASPQSPRSTAVTRRASVDTLVDRLGLLEVDDQDERRENMQPLNSQRRQNERPVRSGDQTRRPRPNPDKRSSLALLCLLGATDHPEYAPRPVRNQDQQPRASAPMPPRRRTREIQTDHARARVHSNQASSSPNSFSAPPGQPPISRDPPSRKDEFLSLIPGTASTQTTWKLLSELDKPVSTSDVPGYIYIYWIAPESLSPLPLPEVTSSLFEVSTSPTQPRPGHRRTSEILQRFSSPSTTRNGKILIKIGQTVNVQRRLNQWFSQCGHNVSVARCYPHRPSSPSTRDPSSTPAEKVPFARKVERLIHIELAASRAQGIGRCVSCNREHREWFEVEASRNGITAVDEVIRRWVDWGLRVKS